MSKKLVSEMSLALIFVCMLALEFKIEVVEAEARTWIVDDNGPADFHTIQEAINVASEGDTISVYSGTYFESVGLKKAVSLIGENRITTVIYGNIRIEADWVNITGFSITGGADSAIYFPRYCSHTTVSNCNIFNNDKGMYSYEPCSHTSMIDCNIFNNRYGIVLYGASHVVKGCNVFSNDFQGIALYTPSSDCIIENCSVWNNRDHGAISVAVSSDHVIKNSWIFNNTLGVSFVGNGINPVTHHVVTNCDISTNIYGIYLSSTLHSHINITNCNISDNEWGVSIRPYSYSNSIYHNNFIGNANQAKDESTNSWDDGYPSGGNYWSDYSGVDVYSGPYQNETGSDGIGDTSHSIDIENEDEYPLMNPRPLTEIQQIDYEFYGLLANYKELQSKYDNLQSSYDNLNATYEGLLANYNSLQAELNNLQTEHDSLTNELNVTRNNMYVFLTTTMVFIVTTVYFGIRKSKVKAELKAI